MILLRMHAESIDIQIWDRKVVRGRYEHLMQTCCKSLNLSALVLK